MRLLSLWQPWASCMAAGHKSIETRPWTTSYRGDIAIQAGLKRFPAEFIDAVYRQAGLEPPAEPHPHGSILCVVELHDIWSTTMASQCTFVGPREIALGNYEIGRFAWITRNLRVLSTPLPFKGCQGLRNLTLEAERQVRSLIAA